MLFSRRAMVTIRFYVGVPVYHPACAGTKLCSLVSEVNVCELVSQDHTRQCSSWD